MQVQPCSTLCTTLCIMQHVDRRSDRHGNLDADNLYCLPPEAKLAPTLYLKKRIILLLARAAQYNRNRTLQPVMLTKNTEQ